MVLITFLKPNLIIHSDKLMTGSIKVFDMQKHILWSLKLVHKNFVSIKAKPDWPDKIEIELYNEDKLIKKELMI